jgi:hypothetical protein
MRSMVRLAALAGLSASIFATGAMGPSTYAESPERQAADICSYAEDVGALKEMGRTRVDCVSAIVGPKTPEASVEINALCAVARIREKVGAAERKQCADMIQELITGA